MWVAHKSCSIIITSQEMDSFSLHFKYCTRGCVWFIMWMITTTNYTVLTCKGLINGNFWECVCVQKSVWSLPFDWVVALVEKRMANVLIKYCSYICVKCCCFQFFASYQKHVCVLCKSSCIVNWNLLAVVVYKDWTKNAIPHFPCKSTSCICEEHYIVSSFCAVLKLPQSNT